MGRNGRHARQPGPYNATDCEKYIREHGLHNTFKGLLRNPEEVAQRWAFHRFIDASKRFHILRPIVIETDLDEFAISKFLGVLTAIGLQPITAQALRAMQNKGLVSCSCELYLEHAWCHHSCTFALHRSIIWSYPPHMNPKPTMQVRVGRPENAVRGGCRGRT
jgi:hypothetical protein